MINRTSNCSRELSPPESKRPGLPAFGVVILAAGASSRMGQPKLVLPWGDTTIVGHLIRQWQSAGAHQIAIVLSVANQALINELDRLAFPDNHRLFNPQPDQGMFSSIQCAARWAGWDSALSHWVLTLGDQPQLRLLTLAALIEAGSTHPDRICQLRYLGRPRHPVWLPRSSWVELQSTTANTLREFLHTAQSVLYWTDYSDPGLAMDIDRPGDYLAAMEQYFKKA